MKHDTPYALVTGGGSGLGRAITWTLCTQGINVIIVGRQRDNLLQTQARYPDQISIVTADLALPESWNIVAERVGQRRLHYLIHNAATSDPVANLSEINLYQWRSAMSINVEAPLFLTQALLPQMAEQGRILFISTGAASVPISGLGAYCCTKAAVDMVRKIFALELQQHTIFVASLLPGVVDTNMQTLIREQDTERYPIIQEFKRFAQDGLLRAPGDVGEFIGRVLTTTNNNIFCDTEWNIDRQDHESLLKNS